MLRSQKGNQAVGDIVAGDKLTINNVYSASPLNRLYERLRSNAEADAHTKRIAEELQHYCTASTDGDVRGLEAKLAAADREHMLPTAQRLKQLATKTLMRLETSPLAQAILTLVLSKMYTDFTMYVTPAIEDGGTKQDVDLLIGKKVIDPAIEMLGDNDLMLTSAEIFGLLFFLGGNCHIRWDKC